MAWGKFSLDKNLKQIGEQGDYMWDTGSAMTTEGLDRLRGLYSRFEGQLNEGGLTPELQRQFDVAAGRNTDQYVRSGRALKAALQARRAQSGGALTAGAIAEYEKEGEVSASEQYFDASNELAGEKAMLAFSSTKDLFDRMTNISDTIRTTGLTREQQALLARLQAAALKLQNKKVTLDALTSVFRGLSSGA